MSYKEYILLKKKYMETETYNNNTNNTCSKNISMNINQEERKIDIKNNPKEDKTKIRSKSKSEKIRKYNFDDNTDNNNELKETKKLLNTNLDEHGNEVLNENLFKNRQNEYKPMRKTFTGKFFPKKGSQQKDIKRETFYNFNNKFNSNNGLNFNNHAYKSYYGGFKNNNVNKKQN